MFVGEAFELEMEEAARFDEAAGDDVIRAF